MCVCVCGPEYGECDVDAAEHAAAAAQQPARRGDQNIGPHTATTRIAAAAATEVTIYDSITLLVTDGMV